MISYWSLQRLFPSRQFHILSTRERTIRKLKLDETCKYIEEKNKDEQMDNRLRCNYQWWTKIHWKRKLPVNCYSSFFLCLSHLFLREILSRIDPHWSEHWSGLFSWKNDWNLLWKHLFNHWMNGAVLILNCMFSNNFNAVQWIDYTIVSDDEWHLSLWQNLTHRIQCYYYRSSNRHVLTRPEFIHLINHQLKAMLACLH